METTYTADEASIAPAALDRDERDEFAVELDRLGPFHHAIDLPFGLNTYDRGASRGDRESMGRLDSLRRHLWPTLLRNFGGNLEGKRVLDVACNCGGFSVLAAQSGARHVVGIDSEEHYIRQAEFVRDALKLPNVEFRVGRLEDLDPDKDGSFDIVFFFGILYHLEEPIRALKTISAVARDMIVVDTSMMRLPYIDRFVANPMWSMKIVSPIADPDITTGLWRRSRHCQFYPNEAAVRQALDFVGFEDVRYLKPIAKELEPRYYKGTRAVFMARKPG